MCSADRPIEAAYYSHRGCSVHVHCFVCAHSVMTVSSTGMLSSGMQQQALQELLVANVMHILTALTIL
jgi:hypothetical protein